MSELKTRIIKIFLAASEELDYDRNVFGNLIRRLDDLYEKRGIRIKLFEWEDYDSAYNDQRKQDEYNNKVRESDIFLALFYKKAGQFTIEEFNVAAEQFKEKTSPKVYTFCKDLKQSEEESAELSEFKKKLFDEMGHYWCRYDSRESLQFQFVMQLQLVEGDQMSELKVENGDVTIDGIRVAPMDKLRFATDNEDYVRMSKRLTELPKLINQKRLLVEKYPNEDVFENELQVLLDENNKLQEDIVKTQTLLLNTAKRISQLQGERITDRMRRAMDFFNDGKVLEANVLLDEAEIDARQALKAYKESKEITEMLKQAVVSSIKELQLKADIVMSNLVSPIDDRVTKTKQIYAFADEMAQAVCLGDYENSQILFDYAHFLYEYGHYKESIKVYLRLISLLERQEECEQLFLANSYNRLGKVYYYYGDNSKALEYYFKALEIRKRILGEKHPDVAESYSNIGLAYKDRNTLDYYFKALRIRELVLGDRHPDTATSYNNIGAMYQRQGDYEKALEFHNKALQIRENVLGKEHPHIAFSYNNIGAVYFCLGNYTKAMEYHSKAMEIREKVLGKGHPFTASSYGHLGKIYCKEGNYEKALEYHFKDLQICEKVFGKTQPEIAFPYNDIGVVYYKMGDYSKSLEYLHKALKVRELALGNDNVDIATTYYNIGLVYDSQGYYVKALDLYERALSIRMRNLGQTHPDIIKTEESITKVKQKMEHDAQ